MTAPALELEAVSSGYRSAVVLRGTSLSLAAGEAVAVLGKNGMGKSTLLKTIMGYLPKKAGAVRLAGRDITRAAPHRVSRLGVAYAAQEHAIFTELSIRDNLRLALAHDALFDERFPAIERAFPVFASRLKQYAGTLSGGEQKMLLVARALMTRPAVVLLDEITEGLQPSVIDRIAEALVMERRERGTTLLLIEQNVAFALHVADRWLLLKQGEFVDEGSARSPNARADVFEHLKV
jgi:ABC-type branched-subunit amino acid transport system ATPase component